jgi:uncharacterized protein (DUF885 family)
MLSRRHLLSSTASLAVAAALPFRAFADVAATSPAAAQLDKLMDDFFQEGLRENPEGATQLGLDKGPNADLKSKLRDNSPAGRAKAKAVTLDQLKQLRALDASSLTGMDRVNYDTVLYTRESAARVQSFDFGGSSFGPSPSVPRLMS